MSKIFSGVFENLNCVDNILRSSNVFVSSEGIDEDGIPFVIVGSPDVSKTVTIKAIDKKTFNFDVK